MILPSHPHTYPAKSLFIGVPGCEGYGEGCESGASGVRSVEYDGRKAESGKLGLDRKEMNGVK